MKETQEQLADIYHEDIQKIDAAVKELQRTAHELGHKVFFCSLHNDTSIAVSILGDNVRYGYVFK